MVKIVMMSLLFFASIGLSQNTQAIDNIDRIYLGFTASNPDPSSWNGYIAEFLAVKFWYVTGGQVPNPDQPTNTYARAWYNPEGDNQYNEFVRLAFNGTPLSNYPHPRLGPIYYMKRSQDMNEDWISWYANLDAINRPEALAFDTLQDFGGLIPEAARLNLEFPAPYKLNFSDNFTIGGSDWSYDLEPALAGAISPAYGELKFYPNRNQAELTYLSVNSMFSPGSISGVSPAGEVGEVGGWLLGEHQGLAGYSTCNEDKIGFEGPKYVLFRACSVVVKPVSINVTRP